MLADKTDNLSLTPEIYKVERKNQLLTVLWPPCESCGAPGMLMCANVYTGINVINIIYC